MSIYKSFNINDFRELRNLDENGKRAPFFGLKWDENSAATYRKLLILD